MRKIIGAAFVSLDGVIQGPGGPTEDPTGDFRYSGWLPPLNDSAVEEQIGKLFGGPFDLLLGRRTYEIFAAYWPFASDAMKDIRDPFDACAKYVVTHGAKPLEWNNSHALTTIDAVGEVKRGDGPDLIIQGSSTLYPQLLAAGLIDQLILMSFPVILGSGKQLFGDGGAASTLRLKDHRVSELGTIIAIYEPAGPVATGTFITEPPSPAECDRRARMEAGSW